MVRRRDWRALIQLRRDLLHAREARRGGRHVQPAHLRRDARRSRSRTFQKTRKTQVLYSVAGTHGRKRTENSKKK